MSIYWLENELPDIFNAQFADDDGLVGIGLDLSVPVLLTAYSRGIFPWFEDSGEIFWFSPDPRMVLYPEDFVISHSLKQTLKKNHFDVRTDTNFREVITRCSLEQRKEQEGTWITPAFIDAYCQLHEEGFAHSFETYLNGELAGGLYGVSIGSVFFGESMFFKESNASKVALAHLVDFSRNHDIRLIDAQQETPHLKSLGARLLSRPEFIKQISVLIKYPTLRGNWNFLV